MTETPARQRQDGFRGGIQLGSTAGNLSSRQLDTLTREYIQSIPSSTRWVKGLSANDLRVALQTSLDDASRIAGFRPDGGIFVDRKRQPLVAVECKFQGERGNAIERWYKNFAISQRLGVKRYVTFCLGDGFFDGRSAERTLGTAVAIFEPEKRDVWDSDEGVLGLYRWRTLEEAEADIPRIIELNLALAGWAA
jgi:hypothetical protein